jgi:hypothetical protein
MLKLLFSHKTTCKYVYTNYTHYLLNTTQILLLFSPTTINMYAVQNVARKAAGQTVARRFASTAPSSQPQGGSNTGLWVGLAAVAAGAAYYATSTDKGMFAEHDSFPRSCNITGWQ